MFDYHHRSGNCRPDYTLLPFDQRVEDNGAGALSFLGNVV